MDVKLPKLGEGAESGVVVNIFVKAGDRIEKDQPIIELENEKAVASIPATAAGVVSRVHVKEGDTLSVGQRILTLEGATPEGAAAPAKPRRAETPPRSEEAAPQRENEAASSEDAVPPAEPTAAPIAGPAVRKAAKELGIDLTRVRGSERGGRIGMADLRGYIERLQKLAAQPRAAAAPAKTAAAPVDFSQWGPVQKKPLSQLRQVIARRMSESWTTIPHVTQFDDADFTRLNELRKKHAPAYEKKGVKLTITPLLLKALAGVLRQHPTLNSSLDESAQELVLKDYIHIGVAVDTEQGLIVPVIRDVDRKSVLALAQELEQLAQKARDRKVTAEELKGGSFTISNQGSIGSAHFTPIINKPQVAILGIGRGALKPVVRDGRVEVRLMTPLALSYDHRVIDGGVAARFVVELVVALEDFKEELVKL